MYIDLDEFYSRGVLNVAKNLLLGQYSNAINRVIPDPEDPGFETILFEDSQLELIIEKGHIDAQLDRIPQFLKHQFLLSNVIEYNKIADSLHKLDLHKPPKFLAAKTDIDLCELFIIAQLIELAIVATFNLHKLTEFQFYTLSGDYLGILTRIRLNRDVFGIFHNYDCLIFAEKYIIEKKDIATLKDISEFVDEEDYCFSDLSDVLDELDDLTLKSFVESEEINRLESLHRIKIPKVPIFHRIPFMAWTQRERTNFYVSDDVISEVRY